MVQSGNPLQGTNLTFAHLNVNGNGRGNNGFGAANRAPAPPTPLEDVRSAAPGMCR